MKLNATITPEQMEQLYPHIRCDDWEEVFEEEYVFTNPHPSMIIIMHLLGITTYQDPYQRNT